MVSYGGGAFFLAGAADAVDDDELPDSDDIASGFGAAGGTGVAISLGRTERTVSFVFFASV